MKALRRVALLATLFVVALLAVWAAQGYNIYTKTAYAVAVTDELFGTTSVVWKPGFRLGLDLTGAGTALAIAAIAGYWWYSRRSTKHSVHA